MQFKATQDNYYELRQEIVERNMNFIGVVLRDDEKRLDEKLRALVADCRSTCGGSIACDVPVIANPAVWSTGLYGFCRSLPKGADLHVHACALMPARKLIDFLASRDDILIDPDTFTLTLPAQADARCVSLSEALGSGTISADSLEKHWTVLGAGADDDIWQYFEALFARHDALDSDMDILYDYYTAAFTDCIINGICHVEIHTLLSMDESKALRLLNCMRRAYYDVKSKHPEFSVRIIGSSMKMFGCSMEKTQAILSNCLTAQQLIKDESEDEPQNFIVGFDLVNEEDTSRALKEYAPMLLKLHEEHPDFKYFLHCGESLNVENDNLIDAYLLGSSRVGHGLNLYRYPELLRQYARKEICLEVCLISNQTLRYTHDLRLHPGAEYLKRGVPIVLCSDDPVYQEHEALTDDFFAAVSAWGLGIAEIKQLCINSIMYSALDEQSRRRQLHHWHNAWNDFVKAQLEE